jgi:carbon storage regulator
MPDGEGRGQGTEAVLVVTRKRNEAIIIGDAIEVRVLRVGRDGVRLGVTAPPSVPVHRTEIYKLICEENRAAAEGGTVPTSFAERLRLPKPEVPPGTAGS